MIILLPNLVYLLFPPVTENINNLIPDWWNVVLILENIRRILVFLLPFFYKVTINTPTKKLALVIMLVTAIIYYVCWARYLIMVREYILLFKNLFFIPIPMAVMPIIYLLAARVLLESKLIIIASLILVLGHIPESYMSYISVLNK